MRHATLAAVVAAAYMIACDVYDSSLLGEGGAPDVAVEACTTTCGGSKCINLQTDQNNCGSCGKTCEVACAGGLCTPTVLAMGLGAPHGLVVTDGKIYVANSGNTNVNQPGSEIRPQRSSWGWWEASRVATTRPAQTPPTSATASSRRTPESRRA